MEEELSETQVMLAQEQQEHQQLQYSRAKEAELWSDERETSLSLVKEMTREVRLQASFPAQPTAEPVFLIH